MILYIQKKIFLHFKILKYLCCSVVSALFEAVLGWVLLKLLTNQIVIANTIAIIVGAVLHYFLTLLFVFRKRNNYKSFIIYVSTFLLGIFLQDAVIWFFYYKLTGMTEVTRYAASKGLSLVIPFYALYYIRSILNEKIKLKEC